MATVTSSLDQDMRCEVLEFKWDDGTSARVYIGFECSPGDRIRYIAEAIGEERWETYREMLRRQPATGCCR